MEYVGMSQLKVGLPTANVPEVSYFVIPLTLPF
jgi:hypothetical protein